MTQQEHLWNLIYAYTDSVKALKYDAAGYVLNEFEDPEYRVYDKAHSALAKFIERNVSDEE